MKKEDKFKDIIRDIGCDPFYIHYYNPEQIHMYRKYCSNVKYPQIIIDATGSVVKKFMKFGLEKTKHIFLYEAIVYDREKSHSFTVSNMLSERHNTISISNWLANWINCDIPKPKQTVCDQSLALLSAVVRTFTQYSSLKSYIDACADIITKKLSNDSRWLPQCYIKLDVAHFIKLASHWPPLKLLQRKAREIILRTIGRLIKCQQLDDIHSILLSFFIVITNESNGVEKNTGIETSCECHYRTLLNIASTGNTEFDLQLDDIINNIETEDNTCDIARDKEECDNQHEGLGEINPFQTWAENVYAESKRHIQDGIGINPLYAPKIVPYLIKMTKLLPLWSGVMVPFFGYGEGVSSSAAVESSFHKLKNITFKHISLPTDIETFLDNHILSLRGASLLRSVQVPTTDILTGTEKENTDVHGTNNLRESKCPLCKSGSLPTENGAHKCSVCGIPVHAISQCSTYQLNDDEIRICFTCFDNIEMSKEDRATDEWNRRPKNQLKSNSYLIPNPHLRHINLSNARNPRILPLLKNGSRAEELKSCNLKSINRSVILSNTCTFDSIASVVMVSFCDSQIYSNGLLQSKTKFVDFISKLVLNGITSNTYTERAELIIFSLKPNIEELQYNTSLVICDTTPKTICKSMLCQFPTIVERSICSNLKCEKHKETLQPVHIITFNTTSSRIDDLQQFFTDRLNAEESLCNYTNELSQCTGLRKTSFDVSPLHLLIEVLFWRGK